MLHGARDRAAVLELVGSAALHGRPTESALEVAVERCLAGLPGVVRQHEVRDLDGALIARVDFAIPELKIAIEAHSRRHHFGPLAEEHDASREASLQAGGWIVRFITDAQRRRPAELLASLTALVASRQASIGVCGSSTR